MQFSVRLGVLLLACSLLLGCDGSDGPARFAVSGKVTLGGEPIENGSIQFDPQGPPQIASGAVIENGEYSISSDRGLPAGKYIVRISAASESGVTEEVPGESRQLAQELVPPEYNVESDKTIEVSADGANEFDFSIPKP